MRKYEQQAQELLEFNAEYHDRTGGGIYTIRVFGKFLADECTYALKLKIEKELGKREREQKRSK